MSEKLNLFETIVDYYNIFEVLITHHEEIRRKAAEKQRKYSFLCSFDLLLEEAFKEADRVYKKTKKNYH